MRKKKTAEEVLGLGNVVFLPNHPDKPIGVVVSNHIINGVDIVEGGFLVVGRPDMFYVCMAIVWGIETNDKISPPVKSEKKPESSACGHLPYLIGKKDSTVLLDLSKELELYQYHLEKLLKGPDYRIFKFSEVQENLLVIVFLVQHYLRGGSIGNLPVWLRHIKKRRNQLESLFSQLKRAIPRS